MHLSSVVPMLVLACVCVQGVPVVASVDLTPYVTATQDGGTAKTNFAWYEQGFNHDHPTLGLPHAGVIHGEADPQSTFLLRPYTANNVLLLDGTDQAGRLTLATPTPAVALAFATASG